MFNVPNHYTFAFGENRIIIKIQYELKLQVICVYILSIAALYPPRRAARLQFAR